jgi:hypothetical protein
MTTILKLKRTGVSPVSPPPDLRESLGEPILLKLALDGVQSLDPAKLKLAANGTAPLRPQMMLTLLSYCYAARIYGSRDIEWAIRNNATVRYIVRTCPGWRSMRRFRRNNRELLEECLAYVLKKAWLLQLDADCASADWSGAGSDLDRKSLAEARQKIEVAIIMDTAEND